MDDIKRIGSFGSRYSLELPKTVQQDKTKDFKEYLQTFIREVDQLQKEADITSSELATGELKNIHQAMITMEKADISFRLMVEVRNKIIKAYEEIIKMQV